MQATITQPANSSPSSAIAPRSRATAITAAAKAKVKTTIGTVRWKSANWYAAGPSLTGVRYRVIPSPGLTPEA